jgi:hypothetical protein
MRLFELANQYETLLRKLEREEDFNLEDELNQSEEALHIKLDSVAWMYRNLEAESEAYAAEAKRLKDKADSRAKAAEKLKNYIGFCLRGEPLKTKSFNFTFRKSEQVEILDPDSLPDCYVRIKREPAKDVIKQDLKNGATIVNCGLVTNLNLQIR